MNFSINFQQKKIKLRNKLQHCQSSGFSSENPQCSTAIYYWSKINKKLIQSWATWSAALILISHQ